MKFFSSDSNDTDVPDDQVAELVEKANSDTVITERLTELDPSGLFRRDLNLNKFPIVDYLNEQELAHFIFFFYGESHDNSDRRVWNYCFTDQAFLAIINDGNEDTYIRIPYISIENYQLIIRNNKSHRSHQFVIGISNLGILEQIEPFFKFSLEETNRRQKLAFVISSHFDTNTIEALDSYLGEKITKVTYLKLGFQGDEDIIEEGYISYYSYGDDEYYRGVGGYIGLTETTVKIATEHNFYEIGVEDIVEVNNHQSTRIKTYTEGGSLDFEKDFEKETGLEIISENGESFLYSVRQRGEYPSISENISNYIRERLNFSDRESTQSEYTLIKPFGTDGTLKTEGWTDGDSIIQANVDADAETRGKSRGVEVGPFTRSKTSSKSSIKGNISGEITDNTFTTDVRAFKLYKENLIIDSEIKLNTYYSEIDNIFEQQDGVVIEVGSTTFRIEGVSNSDQIGEAVDFVKEQMTTFAEEETATDHKEDSDDSTDKLRKLKELHEDGILTDEEFQSKKEEILDEF